MVAGHAHQGYCAQGAGEVALADSTLYLEDCGWLCSCGPVSGVAAGGYVDESGCV